MAHPLVDCHASNLIPQASCSRSPSFEAQATDASPKSPSSLVFFSTLPLPRPDKLEVCLLLDNFSELGPVIIVIILQ
jgi:hypothetical protein